MKFAAAISAMFLCLASSAATSQTAKLVIVNGADRYESTVVVLNITPGLTVTVVTDRMFANGFDAPQRASPGALTLSPSKSKRNAAESGPKAPVPGIGERR
jgi:hypothetical protein